MSYWSIQSFEFNWRSYRTVSKFLERFNPIPSVIKKKTKRSKNLKLNHFLGFCKINNK